MKYVFTLAALAAALVFACKGADPSVKRVKAQFDPALGQVPADLPDKPPPEKIGESYTVYGLWLVTQDTAKQKALLEGGQVTVKGYVVNVTQPAEDRRQQDVTPHVWIAGEPNRLGQYFVLTNYTDSYSDLQHARDYDACLDACSKAKGDPRTEADATPGRYSKIFGACVVDVAECRALYEADTRANFFELIGNMFKWYVRDQIFGSPKRQAIEEELRADGNTLCEAGPAQRRVLVTAMVAKILDFDLEQFEKDVMNEIKERYPGKRPDELEPSILQQISNSKLVPLDDQNNNKKLWEYIRALRDGSNPGAEILDDRKLGPEIKALISKGEEDDIKTVADDLINDILIRYFYSKADSKDEANKQCVFDDLINFSSSYNLDPLNLITRPVAMLGPAPGVSWEQAVTDAKEFEFRAEFVPQSSKGFLGWVLELNRELVCAEKSNCPPPVNPVFGTVYDFGFGSGS